MSLVFLAILCVALSIYMLFVHDLLAYYTKRTGFMRFATTFLLFCSQVITTEFVLGVFSVLTGPALILLNILVSSSLLYWLISKNKKGYLRRYLTNTRKGLKQNLADWRRDPWFLVLLTVAVAIVGWIIFLGFIFPATDWDGNSYHLTFIGNVIQNHTFFDVPSSIPWLNGYPKGGEFIQMWSVIITRSDFLTDLTQIPFLVFGIYALYSCMLSLGVRKNHARFSALLFLFLPMVINQLKTTYVDVMLASLFFGALALILQEKYRKLELTLLGVVFSLIIAVKPTGFLFVAVMAPLLIWRLHQGRNKKPKRFVESYIKPLSLVALPTVFGFYWYVKSLVLYGSPLYPFGFKLGGQSVFPGKTFQEASAEAIQSTVLPSGGLHRIWYVWTEQKDWFGCFYNYDTNYAGMGPIWFVILLPAIIAGLYLAIKKRNIILLLLTLMLMVLLAVYPSNYYARYTLFIAAIGIFALGYVLSNTHKIVSYVTKSLAIVLAVFAIFTSFTLCNFSPLTVKEQVKSLTAGPGRGAVYDSLPGPAFVFLEKTIQPDEVVAYGSDPMFIYPLWRPDFANDVVYVEADNETEWYQGLAKKQVKYVFLSEISRERQWAQSHLKSIYKDSQYEIFKTDQ